jgi:hypothetical protein
MGGRLKNAMIDEKDMLHEIGSQDGGKVTPTNKIQGRLKISTQ